MEPQQVQGASSRLDGTSGKPITTGAPGIVQPCDLVHVVVVRQPCRVDAGPQCRLVDHAFNQLAVNEHLQVVLTQRRFVALCGHYYGGFLAIHPR